LQFYNSTVPCTVEFTGHLLSDEILLAVREWERGGNENNQREWEVNGNKTTLNLGPRMGMRNGNEPLRMGGNGTKKDIPAHL